MQIKCHSSLMDEKVSDTGLTYSWILDVLKNYDKNFQKKITNGSAIIKITAKDISENKGYCSKIFKTNIFTNNLDEPIYTFIIKIPTNAIIESIFDDILDEEERKKMEETKKRTLDKLSKFHNVECDFYDIFKDFKGLPMPKVSYTRKWLMNENQTGAIFMEDMSQKMMSLGIFGSLNVIQIKEVVKHLASFHAHLYQTEHLWKTKFEAIHIIDEEFFEMCKTMNDKVVKLHPEFEQSLQKLDNMIYDIKLIEHALIGCCKELGIPTLLALGDLWTNNVMFEKSDDNVPNKILAFVDFQLAFEGNPAFDIARMMTLCTDADIRRELETFIFEYYHENLTKNLKIINKIPEFTVEQFRLAYDFAMINQTTWLPMMTIVFSTNNEMAENIHAARMEKLVLRAKLALEDAAKKLEILKPEWVATLGG